MVNISHANRARAETCCLEEFWRSINTKIVMNSPDLIWRTRPIGQISLNGLKHDKELGSKLWASRLGVGLTCLSVSLQLKSKLWGKGDLFVSLAAHHWGLVCFGYKTINNKVGRPTIVRAARAPQPTTNQPTGLQNEPARPLFAKKKP